MEHIVQFGISIDDAVIKKRIEEQAKTVVINKLKDDMSRKLIDSWGNLTSLSEEIIKRVMDEHKDEIIEKATGLVADSIKRSKKYREALADLVGEIRNE